MRTVDALPESEAARVRMYVGEADFFFNLLEPDLRKLAPGSTVVEIGSGVGLLAMLIASTGHPVVAFEPESSGFGSMHHIRGLLREHWSSTPPPVTWIDDVLVKDDPRAASHQPAYVIAINVVEHVPDMRSLIDAAVSVLTSRTDEFRFICPNYAIPYEPHFEIPTLLSKSLTYRAFGRQILAAPFDDAQGMWDELSWPTPHTLKRVMDELGVKHEFSHQATLAYLRRPVMDESFMERKGPFAQKMFRIAAASMPPIVERLPYTLSPIIDCTVRRD